MPTGLTLCNREDSCGSLGLESPSLRLYRGTPIVIASNFARKTIVVIGNGMVGHRFCERLVEFDTAHQFRIVTFCEEPRAAYDRVGLTSFFAHRDAEQLMLARKEWYLEHGVELHIGDRACELNRETKTVRSQKGVQIDYDICVMATGSYPFVPSIPGIQNRGVFVYRTIEDLNHIIEYSQHAKQCAVIGGGLLGLEAAKAAYDLGLETHVVVLGPRVLARQLDDKASKTLVSKIETLGIHVLLDADTTEVLGNGQVEGLRFKDNSELAVDMVVVSAGIVPRDDLAKASGLNVGPRGGVVVDDHLRTSDPDIFAIGEVALHRSMVYGLVAPGYEMAEIVAANLFDGAQRRVSDRIPVYALYVDPPLGRVGLSEAEARAKGHHVRIGVRPMTRVGRAVEKGETRGFMKVVVDRDSDAILGAAIFGVGGDEAIHGVVEAMAAGVTATAYARVMAIHPTVSELVPTVFGDLSP